MCLPASHSMLYRLRVEAKEMPLRSPCPFQQYLSPCWGTRFPLHCNPMICSDFWSEPWSRAAPTVLAQPGTPPRSHSTLLQLLVRLPTYELMALPMLPASSWLFPSVDFVLVAFYLWK
ncbi:hypothetical protein HAX54_009449 [Datura stramonium]|uniref:Uncharacterized protein n=1 Tax=Datura stramonium TaxID=4076 RepID=A0ABS8TER2_DATST|nr:hypothetical protein [Datura stramonium]